MMFATCCTNPAKTMKRTVLSKNRQSAEKNIILVFSDMLACSYFRPAMVTIMLRLGTKYKILATQREIVSYFDRSVGVVSNATICG